jgi:hypothetical protein
MQLHTADGTRKYLTAGERDAFLREADLADRPVRTLCMTLAYAGCRLSKALALTADRGRYRRRRAGVRKPQEAPHRDFPKCAGAPCSARYNRDGARHSRTARKARQRPRHAAPAMVADDRMAGGACGDAGRRARECAGFA